MSNCITSAFAKDKPALEIIKRFKSLTLDFQRRCCWNRMANLIFCESVHCPLSTVHKIGFDSSFKKDSHPLPDFGKESLVMEDTLAFCLLPGVTEL